MIYLVYRMQLSEHSRRNLPAFWDWLGRRESWFYRDLPMVRGVRWFLTSIGPSYTLETWAAFDDEAALGKYRRAIARRKTSASWERERVSQDDWWHFIDSRLMTDVPCHVGFGAMGQSQSSSRAKVKRGTS